MNLKKVSKKTARSILRRFPNAQVIRSRRGVILILLIVNGVILILIVVT